MTMLSPHAYLKAAQRLSSRFARKALEPDEQEEVLEMRRRRRKAELEDDTVIDDEEEFAKPEDEEEDDDDEEVLEMAEEAMGEDADLEEEEPVGALAGGFEELKQDDAEDEEEVLAMRARRKRRRKAEEAEEDDEDTVNAELVALRRKGDDVYPEELEDTGPTGRLAAKFYRKGISKRMAVYMAAGRMAQQGSFYKARYSAPEQKTNDQPVLGREREENRRQIDAEVLELRRANKNLSYQGAIRKVRARCPYLFA